MALGGIGWHFHPQHWGQGYATEAARAVLHHAFVDQGLSVVNAVAFDGNEAPASLHLTDAAHHDEHHGGHHMAEDVHSDIDLPLADQPLTKPSKLFQDLTLFLFAALCLAFLSLEREHLAPGRIRLRFAPALQRRLPPLRGPPRRGRERPAQVV